VDLVQRLQREPLESPLKATKEMETDAERLARAHYNARYFACESGIYWISTTIINNNSGYGMGRVGVGMVWLKTFKSMAGRQGLEPRYADPESAVLPLDDLPGSDERRITTEV
jgi:hypothetical protein